MSHQSAQTVNRPCQLRQHGISGILGAEGLPAVCGALLLAGVSCAFGYADLQSAYAALGFSPSAAGNAVVVFFSDPHMCLNPQDSATKVVTTNLDHRLVAIVNAMVPSPAKIICAGDVSSSLSPAPGVDGVFHPVALRLATNEMALFAAEITRFTNVGQSQIAWIPGNHDQSPSETNAGTFCRMFPEMPACQAFDLAGVRFILLSSGNYGEPGDAAAAWLRQEVARLSPTREVAVITHQPPFHGSVVHRGTGRLLSEVFAQWQSRWWVFDGHEHWPGLEVYDVGRSNVAQVTIGPASTNTFVGYSDGAGFMLLCLSNGIAGQIYYHYRRGEFDVVQSLDWERPARFLQPFEDAPGLLWRRLKTRSRVPEMLFAWALDSIDWWAYPVELRWAIPLEAHAGSATHFLLLVAGMEPTSTFEFSTDLENWVQSPMPPPTNSIYYIPIPEDMRKLPVVYGRFRSTEGNNWVAGWGLADTNGTSPARYPRFELIPDQEVAAGDTLTLAASALDPYAPPDVLHYTLLTGPPGATLDERTGLFSWQVPVSHPADTVPVKVSVADDYSPPFSATQEFGIKVIPLPPPVAGNYHGVFYETNNPAPEASGDFQFTLSGSKRSYSGKLVMAGVSRRFSGALSQAQDSVTRTFKSPGRTPVVLSLQLRSKTALSGIDGTIDNGTRTLPLRAYRAEYSSRNPAPQAGRYTLALSSPGLSVYLRSISGPASVPSLSSLYSVALPVTNSSTSIPDGCGFASILVSKSGGVTMSGFAADGTAIFRSTALSKIGAWPLYVPLYKTRGFMAAWLRLPQSSSSSGHCGERPEESFVLTDLSSFTTPGAAGCALWFKEPLRDRMYPAGFTIPLQAICSTFNPAPEPAARTRTLPTPLLSFTNGVVSLTGGDLVSVQGEPISTAIEIKLTTGNLVLAESTPEKLRLTVGKTSGTISGTFFHPVTGAPALVRGKVLQDQRCALGYFLTGSSSGSFSLKPAAENDAVGPPSVDLRR